MSGNRPLRPESQSEPKLESSLSRTLEILTERLRKATLETPKTPRSPYPTSAKSSPICPPSIGDFSEELPVLFRGIQRSPACYDLTTFEDSPGLCAPFQSMIDNEAPKVLAEDHERRGYRFPFSADSDSEDQPESESFTRSTVSPPSVSTSRSESRNELSFIDSLTEIVMVYAEILTWNKEGSVGTAIDVQDPDNVELINLLDRLKRATDVFLGDIVTAQHKRMIFDKYMKNAGLILFGDCRTSVEISSIGDFPSKAEETKGIEEEQREDPTETGKFDQSENKGSGSSFEASTKDPNEEELCSKDEVDQGKDIDVTSRKKWRTSKKRYSSCSSPEAKNLVKKSCSESDVSLVSNELISENYIKRLDRSRSLSTEFKERAGTRDSEIEYSTNSSNESFHYQTSDSSIIVLSDSTSSIESERNNTSESTEVESTEPKSDEFYTEEGARSLTSNVSSRVNVTEEELSLTSNISSRVNASEEEPFLTSNISSSVNVTEEESPLTSNSSLRESDFPDTEEDLDDSVFVMSPMSPDCSKERTVYYSCKSSRSDEFCLMDRRKSSPAGVSQQNSPEGNSDFDVSSCSTDRCSFGTFLEKMIRKYATVRSPLPTSRRALNDSKTELVKVEETKEEMSPPSVQGDSPDSTEKCEQGETDEMLKLKLTRSRIEPAKLERPGNPCVR